MTNSSIFQPAHAEQLYNNLRRANTERAEKERFLQYLSVGRVAPERQALRRSRRGTATKGLFD